MNREKLEARRIELERQVEQAKMQLFRLQGALALANELLNEEAAVVAASPEAEKA